LLFSGGLEDAAMAQSWQWLEMSIFSVDPLPPQSKPFTLGGFSRKMSTSGLVEFLCWHSK
jgi:hypothetical protein